MSIGFDKVSGRRKDELAPNKNTKSEYHLRIVLKDVFGFAEHQEKSIVGLNYKLTLAKSKHDVVIVKAAVIAVARNNIDHFYWYVPQCFPSIQQQGLLSKQIISKTPTELKYNERSFFKKEMKNRNLWNFELGSQESIKVDNYRVSTKR